jgi:hypothetical protein
LCRALQAIDLSDTHVGKVVEALEDHLAVTIKDATIGLEGRIDGLEAQIRAQTWLIATLGSVIAIGVLVSAPAPIVAKLSH